jgi:hypothetical protein
MAMWLPFNIGGGMSYETHFLYGSENGSWLDGFLWTDPLRIHTTTFYHLSYLLGEVVGFGGGFLPFQVVYAALWIARGFLVFLIVRRISGLSALAYTAGALTLVHAADQSLLWVGQMNQFGYIFWMLAAFYCLARAFQCRRATLGLGWLALSSGFAYMSLWSYEAQLVLILLIPAGMYMFMRPRWPGAAAGLAAWYLVPAAYIGLSFERYLSSSEIYQESVLRDDWTLNSLLADWIFNVWASVRFWSWGDSTGWPFSIGLMICLVSLAAGAYVLGFLFTSHFPPRDSDAQHKEAVRTSWAAAAVGLTIVITSFPVFLALDSARSLWRTQFLAGWGVALFWSGILVAVALRSASRPLQRAMLLSLGGVIIACGVSAAVEKGAFHQTVWREHRQAIRKLLSTAPQVKPHTVVVMTGVPRSNDPFRDNLWFDVAVRLAYPRTDVTGQYYLDDGSRAPGGTLEIKDSVWLQTARTPIPRAESMQHTVVIDYSAHGASSLLSAVPEYLLDADSDAELPYAPLDAITSHTPADRAIRRYMTCTGLFWSSCRAEDSEKGDRFEDISPLDVISAH